LHSRRSPPILKIGFFRQVMELKIQRKNPGSALHDVDEAMKIFNTTISSYDEMEQSNDCETIALAIPRIH
jgi:hypothetical protein